MMVSPLSGSVPSTASMSTGLGRAITAFSMVCTPLFLKAEPQSTGGDAHADGGLPDGGHDPAR